MDNILAEKSIYTYFIEGFIEVFKMAWKTDIFKSAIIGIPLSIITFKIVGSIFLWGRHNGIWFGRLGGKLLYYCINWILAWLVMKMV